MNIPLSKLLTTTPDDEWTQFESTGIRNDYPNENTVAEYAEAMQGGAKFPPIVAYYDGEKYNIADGFHRIDAADKAGFKDIEAEVREGTREDAIWFALSANSRHGARMTREDVRQAISRALQEFPERSNREIAKQIGCDHKTVEVARRTHEAGGEIPHVESRTGADGKSYPVRREPKSVAVENISSEPDAEPEVKFIPAQKCDQQADAGTAMKSAWKNATKMERESFMAWACGRGSDLPKGNLRDVYAVMQKIRRVLKSNPALLPSAINEWKFIISSFSTTADFQSEG